MNRIFYTSNPWLSDFSSDESFVAALRRTQIDIHEFDSSESAHDRVSIPRDSKNIFPLMVRFADIVRSCSIPDWNIGDMYYHVDDNTVRKLARISASIDYRNEMDSILYSLAVHIFLNWYQFGKYHFWFDNQKFNEVRQETEEQLERENILQQEEEQKKIPVVGAAIGNQLFDLFDIRYDLQSSNKISRVSECHHQDHDEHGASQHTWTFMQSAMSDITNISEYVLRERSILIQIRNNQTKWVRWVLRYSLMYLQEVRRILNEKLPVKIPEEYNHDLFTELQEKDWFIDPRTLIH